MPKSQALFSTFFTKLALTALDKLTLKRLSFGSREQAEQASAAVTLQQQSIIAALVARFKCGLRCHCYNITYK